MKIKKEHLAIIESRMLDTDFAKNLNETVNHYTHNNLSFTRFIWDWFWSSKTVIGDGFGLNSNCGISIQDCHDSHIETAIKAIAKKHGITASSYAELGAKK